MARVGTACRRALRRGAVSRTRCGAIAVGRQSLQHARVHSACGDASGATKLPAREARSAPISSTAASAASANIRSFMAAQTRNRPSRTRPFLHTPLRRRCTAGFDYVRRRWPPPALELAPSPTAPVPPQNLEAEESVLGAMMLSPGAIGAVSEILDAGDFYRESHAKIYRAALALYAKGEPVDAITLVDELERARRARGRRRPAAHPRAGGARPGDGERRPLRAHRPARWRRCAG